MLEPLQDLHYENMFETSQGVRLEVADVVGGYKVRYRIYADSHCNQSYAVAEVWSPDALRWNEVATYAPQLWWEAVKYAKPAKQAEVLGEAQNELEARLRATLL
jgi:hypothetical protein